ncbi:MAG: hypothetical protein NW241_14700 [Bacteroidia bacterium]|nr:hypothetical protein [Bacteroidia bacterium]
MASIPPEDIAAFLREPVPDFPDIPMLNYTKARGTADTAMLFMWLGPEAANKVAQRALDQGKTIEVYIDTSTDEIIDGPLRYRLV